MHTHTTLLAALEALGIAHTTHTHAPVFTVAESEQVTRTIPGAHIKNLFLKDKEKNGTKNHYLVTALDNRTIDLKALGKHLGANDRLSFADETTLDAFLGVKPGSVTPLALINAKPGSLRFVLDEGILNHPIVNPHPLRNDMTTSLSPQNLLTAIQSWGHNVEILNLGLFPRA